MGLGRTRFRVVKICWCVAPDSEITLPGLEKMACSPVGTSKPSKSLNFIIKAMKLQSFVHPELLVQHLKKSKR